MPSTRFRWTQHAPELAAAGFCCTEFDARFGAYAPRTKNMRSLWLAAAAGDSLWRTLRARSHDLRFLQRNLIATLSSWEPLLSKPLVFDVDDAIFLGKRGASADRIARHATLILCGNAFLAEHFSRHGRVALLPTAVDTERFSPAPASPAGPPVIGWSGSSSGFAYLHAIEPALGQLLTRWPEATLRIVADRPPHFHQLPADRVHFERWTAASEVQALHSFSVGLMPLADDDWSRGKCSFKMLTYMAVGLPVVVSPVGMNIDVLAQGACGLAARSTDDWVDAISHLLDHPSQAAQMGHQGRRIVETHYGRQVVGRRLVDLLRSVL